MNIKSSKKPSTIYDYLELCGGIERFSFYQQNAEGVYITDEKGNAIPDFDAAYKYGNELREKFGDTLSVEIRTNMVVVRLAKVTAQ